MKAEVEKIRDDLFVKKTKFGYEVVYPIKIDATKSLFAKGNINKKNFNMVLKREIFSSIGILIPVVALLLILYPGAHQLKEKCQDNIAYLIENSCDICLEKESNGYGSVFGNFSLNKEASKDVG